MSNEERSILKQNVGTLHQLDEQRTKINKIIQVSNTSRERFVTRTCKAEKYLASDQRKFQAPTV